MSKIRILLSFLLVLGLSVSVSSAGELYECVSSYEFFDENCIEEEEEEVESVEGVAIDVDANKGIDGGGASDQNVLQGTPESYSRFQIPNQRSERGKRHGSQQVHRGLFILFCCLKLDL